MNFAKENKITEIYYCSDNFDEDVSSFISKANKLDIKVYWLAGDYKWFNDFSLLYEKINNYINYQNEYPNQRLSGIHFDIEPYQDSSFDENRIELITKLVELASSLKSNYPGILFDYDLPFWLEDEVTFNNVTLPAYKNMINISSRVFLMIINI